MKYFETILILPFSSFPVLIQNGPTTPYVLKIDYDDDIDVEIDVLKAIGKAGVFVYLLSLFSKISTIQYFSDGFPELVEYGPYPMDDNLDEYKYVILTRFRSDLCRYFEENGGVFTLPYIRNITLDMVFAIKNTNTLVPFNKINIYSSTS